MAEPQWAAHPSMTMDDITEVAGDEQLTRIETIPLGKHVEIDSRTLIAAILGGVAGFLLVFPFAPLVGWQAGMLLIIGFMILSPLLFVARGRRTQQKNIVIVLNKLKSGSVTGKAFFPGNPTPYDLTISREHVYWL